MSLESRLIQQLNTLRGQGMKMAEINPVAALGDEISDHLAKGEITSDQLNDMLDRLSADLWQSMTKRLATQTGAMDQAALDLSSLLPKHDCTKKHLMRSVIRQQALRKQVKLRQCRKMPLQHAPQSAFRKNMMKPCRP